MNRLRQAAAWVASRPMVRWLRRRGPTIAWVVLVGLMAAGFVTVQRLQRDMCEADNELRQEALPTAFDRFGRRLGREFNADQERVDEFIRGFDDELHDLFPPADC